ncbi:LysE family translocator [Glutamicibacter sp. NPDC087344]|uniref:LysE family translocator n=1 Tax=Glutamicibacter sp. NPDC087344 TaxID=3363994 RepID=UPI00381496E3
MDLGQLFGFLLVSVTLACTPGADWAYIISSALGKSSYRPAVWGLLSGYLFHTALVVCGIAAVVAGSPAILTWLTTAGSVYLLWLGFATLRSWKSAAFYDSEPTPSPQLDAATEAAQDTAPENETSRTLLATRTPPRQPTGWRAPYFKGLFTSGINPKALLLYVALIPQFLDKSSDLSLTLQTGILGLTHFLVSVAVYFSVALAARLSLRSRPAAARVVTLCSGLIMIALAVMLILEQFFVA